jgi:hypothetical protein
MLRIHFTTADLARTRVAIRPDPLWETALSMHILRSRDTDPLLEGWKLSSAKLIRSTDGLMARMALPFALNPPMRYFPDFLTPSAGRDGIDAGLQAVLATPTLQLKTEIARLRGSGPADATVVDDIARGRPQALTSLGAALRKYYDTILAPHWTHVGAAVEADRALRGRQMLDEGPATVLNDLAPRSRFRDNMLELHHFRRSSDIHLDGRGVTLVPSYFKETTTLMMLANPSLPPVIVYPRTPEHADRRGQPAAGPQRSHRAEPGRGAGAGRRRGHGLANRAATADLAAQREQASGRAAGGRPARPGPRPQHHPARVDPDRKHSAQRRLSGTGTVACANPLASFDSWRLVTVPHTGPRPVLSTIGGQQGIRPRGN